MQTNWWGAESCTTALTWLNIVNSVWGERMLLVVSKLNVKPHSNTHAHSHIRYQDHLTGHVKTQKYTQAHTHTHIYRNVQTHRLSPTLFLKSVHAHPSALIPQRHRKSKGDPFLLELLLCLASVQMPLSVMETYCMRRDKATFYTDLNGLHYTNLQWAVQWI